ncbi:hypothetical protein ADN00_05200 [Ornatilinea apprima]|uniref:Membrane protein 6-pyruvoyl-tetrahydropterin synthase-related domain-containing protein n=1 Tax=Ornatilinea apprima TaxID=1134406 RepID=A0A0P6XU54_9CHLR|nr:hypothetical protein [Ornatilinea apprima]KPL78656.1 hypothetical protein ADN00_05200 [Ornatilinea apprima]
MGPVSNKNRLQIQPDWLASGLLLVLALVFFSPYLLARDPVLIFPQSNLGTDLTREVWPNAVYLSQAFHQSGEIALWRPFLLSGSPMAGHPVIPLAYLPYWLVMALPPARGLALLATLHVWWAGMGIFFLLRRHFSLGAVSAFIGAVIFSHAPKWIAHLSGGHWPLLYAVAWWPWAWLGMMRYQQTRKFQWLLASGWAIGLMAATDLRILYICLLSLAVWSVSTFQKPAGNWMKATATAWLCAGTLSLLVAAPQILPFLELLNQSNRGGLSIAEAGFSSLPPALILGSFFPPDVQFPEWFVYPGIGAMVLTGAGWAKGWHAEERRWAWAGLTGAALALGTHTPLYALVYRLIPGVSMLRVPARWWIVVLFALAILSAKGTEKWLANQPWKWRRFQFFSLGMTAILVSAAILRQIKPDLFPFEARFPALFFIGFIVLLWMAPQHCRIALVGLLVIAAQWSASLPLIRPYAVEAISQEDPVAEFLQRAAQTGERSFAPYSGLQYQKWVNPALRTADGYDSFLLAGYAGLVQAASGCGYEGYAVSAPAAQTQPDALRACPTPQPNLSLLRILNVRYLVLPEDKAWNGASPVLRVNGELVYDLRTPMGEFWSVSSAKLTSAQTCIEAIAQTDLTQTALTESKVEPSILGTIQILRWERGVNDARVWTRANQTALLVRSEAWAPGWKAYIDGNETELLRVNCALQGVIVPAGEHIIEFIYQPFGWICGWGGFSAAVITTLITLWLKRKTQFFATLL